MAYMIQGVSGGGVPGCPGLFSTFKRLPTTTSLNMAVSISWASFCGCPYNVLTIRALLSGVCLRELDFWKLPYGNMPAAAGRHTFWPDHRSSCPAAVVWSTNTVAATAAEIGSSMLDKKGAQGFVEELPGLQLQRLSGKRTRR